MSLRFADDAKAWRLAIADGVDAERLAGLPGRRADFRRLLADAERRGFPMREASAELAASGFVRLGKAFAIAESDVRRDELAPAVAAAAKAVDSILDEPARELAQRRGHL